MRKNKTVLLAILSVMLISCTTNEPIKYTTWRCVENTPLGSRTYLVDMYRAIKDTTTYLLSNFQNISTEGDYDVVVKLTGTKLNFTPLPQQIGSSQYRITSGSGVVNANFTQIVFNYNIYNGQTETSVQAVYTK